MTDDDLAAFGSFIERGCRAQAAVNFELAAAELRGLGITLARLPGEYAVNYRNGAESTARAVETLEEALELGRAMAADAPAPAGPAHGKVGYSLATPVGSLGQRRAHAPGSE